MPEKKKLYGKTRNIPVLKTSLETCSWICRGKIRKFVFMNIGRKTMPSQLVEKLAGKIKRKSLSYYAQVNRAIAELQAQGLVRCLNQDEKTGRF